MLNRRIKPAYLGVLAAMCAACLVTAACNNGLVPREPGGVPDEPRGVPAELADSSWTRAMDSSLVRLDFGTNGVYVSGSGSQWEGYCRINPSRNGGCEFWNDSEESLVFDYLYADNVFTITACNYRPFIGQWARAERHP